MRIHRIQNESPNPSIPKRQFLQPISNHQCPALSFSPDSESPFGYHNSVSQVSGGIYPAVPLQPLEVDRKPSAKPKSMRTTRGSSQSLPAAKLGTRIAASQFINPLVQINLDGDQQRMCQKIGTMGSTFSLLISMKIKISGTIGNG